MHDLPGASGTSIRCALRPVDEPRNSHLTRRLPSHLSVLIIALAVLATDQITKEWVRNTLVPGVPYDPLPWLRPVLSLTYVTNTGVAFGLFRGWAGIHVLIALVVITVLILFYRHMPYRHPLVNVSFGLQLGGAFGNLVDRLRWQGQVIDFIDLNFWPMHEWPVFNVADSSLVVGVFVLALYILLVDSKGTNSSKL